MNDELPGCADDPIARLQAKVDRLAELVERGPRRKACLRLSRRRRAAAVVAAGTVVAPGSSPA
jgi:hypothetical protein